MLDLLFTSVISGTVSWQSILLCTFFSLLLGTASAGVYCYKNTYTKSFVVTLALLPAMVQIVIMLVNGNLGVGVAVMGTFSLVRFRSVPGSAREIGSLFFAMALGLATGVIASVINQMGSMLPNNVIGVIAFVVIFIAGHTLNLAINLLGAYVHTNRLQFVEFFGKFYEGGGEPFNPFKENTKYADVKEETLS